MHSRELDQLPARAKGSGLPMDIEPLRVMADWRRQGHRPALLTIVAIDGKSPRSIGARMVVREDGTMHGYLTGGCLEAELSVVARKVIAEGQNRMYRYGKGSPFIDLKLPCGSGIDVYFDQGFPDSLLFEVESRLDARQPTAIETNLNAGTSRIVPLEATDAFRSPVNFEDGKFVALVKPALHLDVYGSGMSPVQLATVARAAGLDVRLVLGDELTADVASGLGLDFEMMPAGTFAAPVADAFSAAILVFHSHEKELPVLAKLVDEPAFYIGAIGSRRVSEDRTNALIDMGIAEDKIGRITMQAGLVRGARTATEIAIGVVAEVLDCARRGHRVG